jgi:hypothetical protein
MSISTFHMWRPNVDMDVLISEATMIDVRQSDY